MNVDLRSIIGSMNQLHILHRLYIHKAAVKNGLYFGQLPILETIIEHDNCSQREIAEILQVSPPSIATSVKRMQKSGLIEKIADENDMRYTHITVTKKGRDLVQKCRLVFNEIDKQMFKSFTEGECKQFSDYLDRIIQNMSTDEYKDKKVCSLIAEITKIDIKHKKEGENCD